MTTTVRVENGVQIEASFFISGDGRKIPCRPQKGVFSIRDGGSLTLGLAGARTDIPIRDLRQRPGDVKPHRATVRKLDGTIVDVYPGETKSFPDERITITHAE